MRIIKKPYGTTSLGFSMSDYVIGTPENIANLDAGRNDGAFWSGVVSGRVAQADGLAGVRTRPRLRLGHGDPARQRARRRRGLDPLALRDGRPQGLPERPAPAQPSTSSSTPRATPTGATRARSASARRRGTSTPTATSACAHPARERVVRPRAHQVPGPVLHRRPPADDGLLLPAQRRSVNHEISDFAINFIQNKIGPALQQRFNDQSAGYRNYNTYDLFTPEYGDTVPSLIMGAAGMTYEKGETESYGKQVYDHYLAMDTTVNLTSDDKVALLTDWVKQWQQATDQGAACALQPNKLVSPLHTTIDQQPSGSVCGYFFKPGLHSATSPSCSATCSRSASRSSAWIRTRRWPGGCTSSA